MWLEAVSVLVGAIGVGWGIYKDRKGDAESERLRRERDQLQERVTQLEDGTARRAAFDDMRRLLSEAHRYGVACIAQHRYPSLPLTRRFVDMMLSRAEVITRVAFPAKAAALRRGLAESEKGTYLQGNPMGTERRKMDAHLAALASVVESLRLEDLAEGVGRRSLPGWSYGSPFGDDAWPKFVETEHDRRR